jgi:uncharacterized membrane protein
MWMLGLAFALMTLGVLSVDFWALIAERRELASLADASAVAAASTVDEAAWRHHGALRLDRGLAEARAMALLGSNLEPRIEFDADGVTVRVSVSRTVETALLGLAGRDFVTVSASSRATAILRD